MRRRPDIGTTIMGHSRIRVTDRSVSRSMLPAASLLAFPLAGAMAQHAGASILKIALLPLSLALGIEPSYRLRSLAFRTFRPDSSR
jgi:hypothetical protein